MSLRIAIVGPGRVGRALARRWCDHGEHIVGFVGRDRAGGETAAAWLGAGRALAWRDLASAHVVVFATGDDDLTAAIAAALAAAPPRRCSLWLHTSGRHDLTVFAAAVQAGARCGSLHPVAPFPDADRGAVHLPGAPAVLAAGARSERLLQRLAAALGCVPIAAAEGDRALYHAACALAANGLCALFAEADATLAASGGLAAADRPFVLGALLQNALAACRDLGPVRALTGPVRRGDAATVAAHVAALAPIAPTVLPTYRALMQRALLLAADAGLGGEAQRRVAAALAGAGEDAWRS